MDARHMCFKSVAQNEGLAVIMTMVTLGFYLQSGSLTAWLAIVAGKGLHSFLQTIVLWQFAESYSSLEIGHSHPITSVLYEGCR